MKRFLEQPYHLGEVVIDPQRNILRRGDSEERLEPKLVALLACFAAADGSVLSRRHIAEQVWPGAVVGEDALTRAIFCLRNLLLDDAKKPRYIETVPKKGYRLMQATTLKSTQNTLFTGRTFWLGATGVALMIVASILFFVGSNEAILKLDGIRPISHLVGSETDIVLDKRAERLAFISMNKGSTDLYIQELANGQSRPLTKDGNGKWSPIWIDDKTLVYIQRNSDGYEVVSKTLDGLEHVVYQSPYRLSEIENVPGSHNEIWISEMRHNERSDIVMLNIATQNVKNIKDSAPSLPPQLTKPRPHSNGNLYFLAADGHSPRLVKFDQASHEITEISAEFKGITDFTPISGTQFAIAGEYNDILGVWLYDIEQGTHLLFASSTGEIAQSLSYDRARQRLYYATFQKPVTVGQRSLMNSKEPSHNTLETLVSSGQNGHGHYSNDNQSLFFISDRSGAPEIWRYHVKSQQLIQVSRLKSRQLPSFALSHDDSLLAIYYATDQPMLGIVDTTSGQLINSAAVDGFVSPLSWSLDNRHVYATEHSAQVNLYRYDVKTLQAELIQGNAGLFAKEENNGKSLRYMDYAHQAVVERSLMDGASDAPEILSAPIPNLTKLHPGQFIAEKDFVAFVTFEANKRFVARYDYDLSDSRKPVISLHQNEYVSEIRKDGKELLFFTIHPPNGDAMVADLK